MDLMVSSDAYPIYIADSITGSFNSLENVINKQLEITRKRMLVKKRLIHKPIHQYKNIRY